ncbi:heterokaryon incompatibility protein-domain-containing protein [Aspergillus multicolor]|uniref:HET domain-containing protein n=1 Tax=Aspergillus multicolor TaxID=41759 RepID=UPI003CCD1F86
MKGFIQKAGARRPISVSVMLDSGNFDGAEPYTARLRPPMADPRLFRFWKDWCMREHQGHCGRNEITTGRSMASIRLVDVFENCVATLDVMEHVEWVALSYVWGEAQAHALVKGNYNAYHEQGALKFDRMPATILDAMWVTRELGERYLWIDSLCIIQDDEDDKLQYIPAMDIIYSQSIITIVNAATDKVSSGIPGIRQGAPRSEQDVFELNGTWLTLSLDPAHSSNNAYLNQTKWATRGWTYQECLLSRRCLIFTKEQAYWQCLGSSFCEDTNWEIRSDIHPVMYRHCLGNSWPDVPSLQALYGNTDAHWSRVYPMAVEQFRQRQLTSDHDRLHAFTGILRALEYSAGLKTFWGMPIPCLQRALVWTELEPLTRNTSSQSIRPNGEPCPFPSWSWVGWSGPISIDVNRTHEIRGRLYFRYYSLGHEGDPIPLTNRSDDAVSCFDGSDEDRWFNPTQTEITRLQIPDSVRSSHAAPGLLCFWTSTAVLNISLGDATQIYHSGNLIDGEIKVSSHMAAEEPCLRVKQGRFIVIDAATRREPRPVQPVLKVMLVDEDDSGVCYRRFLFTNVCPFRWARLENLKWEVVCLG